MPCGCMRRLRRKFRRRFRRRYAAASAAVSIVKSPKSTGSLGHQNNGYSDNDMVALLRLDPDSRAPRNANPEVFSCPLLRVNP